MDSTTLWRGVKNQARQGIPQNHGTNCGLAPLIQGSLMTGDLEFEDLVNRYYAALYQFALSLTQAEADAADLTQQTFYRWATRGHQLRDHSKIKTWLFTTLHREFLQRRRRHTRFPHLQLDEADVELPTLTPEAVSTVDWEVVLRALGRLEETLHAPLALFYLEECSYNEISEILDIPLGTVKSRIFRGMAQLQQSLRGDLQTFENEGRAHD
jgi:RNA polymerase sigma factor (sigma-70 family)